MVKKYVPLFVIWVLSIILTVFITSYIILNKTEPVGGFTLEDGVSIIKITENTTYEFSDGTSATVNNETVYHD